MIKTILYTYLSKAFKVGMWFSILWLIVNFILLVSDVQNFKPEILGLIAVCYTVSGILKTIGFNHFKKTEQKIEKQQRSERLTTGRSSGFRNRLDLAMEARDKAREQDK
jgi:hypothetical protein